MSAQLPGILGDVSLRPLALRPPLSALCRKSLNEIVATKPTAAYDAKWGTGFVNGGFFTKLVHEGVGSAPAHRHNPS